MQRILQAVQDGINLFAGNNQWRLDTHNSRIIESIRYEYTTLAEAGGHRMGNISDGSGTSERISTRGGCMNKGIVVQHAPYFRRGHEGANGHHTATQGFGRGDNIGYNTPMFDPPELPGTSHTRLYFVGNEQYFVF